MISFDVLGQDSFLTWRTWFVVQAKMARKHLIPVVSPHWISCCSLLRWFPLQMTAAATMIIEFHQMTRPHQWREEGKSQPVEQKIGIICTVARLMEHEGMKACRDQRSPYYASFMDQTGWSKDGAEENNIRARSMHSGRIHCLVEHTEALLAFIFELREKGMGITIQMVAVKAAQISKSFNNKSRLAQYHSARRFVRAQGLVFCLGTNKSQSLWSIADAMDFIVSVVGWKVLEPTRHQDYNLNKDQTPVPFTYNARKTREIVGRCTVHIRKVYRRYQACNLHNDSHCNRKGFETGNCF